MRAGGWLFLIKIIFCRAYLIVCFNGRGFIAVAGGSFPVSFAICFPIHDVRYSVFATRCASCFGLMSMRGVHTGRVCGGLDDESSLSLGQVSSSGCTHPYFFQDWDDTSDDILIHGRVPTGKGCLWLKPDDQCVLTRGAQVEGIKVTRCHPLDLVSHHSILPER